MPDRIITTDGGDVEIDRSVPLVLSAGDLTRIVQWAKAYEEHFIVGGAFGERTPDAMLLRQIEGWLFPDVWLIGRPGEMPKIVSISDLGGSDG